MVPCTKFINDFKTTTKLSTEPINFNFFKVHFPFQPLSCVIQRSTQSLLGCSDFSFKPEIDPGCFQLLPNPRPANMTRQLLVLLALVGCILSAPVDNPEDATREAEDSTVGADLVKAEEAAGEEATEEAQSPIETGSSAVEETPAAEVAQAVVVEQVGRRGSRGQNVVDMSKETSGH